MSGAPRLDIPGFFMIWGGRWRARLLLAVLSPATPAPPARHCPKLLGVLSDRIWSEVHPVTRRRTEPPRGRRRRPPPGSTQDPRPGNGPWLTGRPGSRGGPPPGRQPEP